jgi:hypothetical protein
MAPLLARSSPKSAADVPKGAISQTISQDNGGSPPDGGTPDFLPHRFQIFQFAGAALASAEMQLASDRIRRVQFFVEKRVENECPWCALPSSRRLRLNPA